MLAALCLAAAVGAAAAPTAAAAAAAAPAWCPPRFCGHLPCPRFEVVCYGRGFERRRYAPAVWVTTNVSALWNYHAAVRMASTELFHYFWGRNAEGLRIPETVPLTVGFR